LPRIGITMGDPAGIGPEVVLKAVAEEEVKRVCVPVIIGDAQLLAHTARTLDLQSGYDIVRVGEEFPDPLSEPVIYHLDNISGFIEPGIESGAAGKATSARCFSVGIVSLVTRSFWLT
jgi:4-hydroxythreonine-4-phosphate dehydrogenase